MSALHNLDLNLEPQTQNSDEFVYLIEFPIENHLFINKFFYIFYNFNQKTKNSGTFGKKK